MSPETLEILQTLGAFILVLMALLSMRIIAATVNVLSPSAQSCFFYPNNLFFF